MSTNGPQAMTEQRVGACFQAQKDYWKENPFFGVAVLNRGAKDTRQAERRNGVV